MTNGDVVTRGYLRITAARTISISTDSNVVVVLNALGSTSTNGDNIGYRLRGATRIFCGTLPNAHIVKIVTVVGAKARLLADEDIRTPGSIRLPAQCGSIKAGCC